MNRLNPGTPLALTEEPVPGTPTERRTWRRFRGNGADLRIAQDRDGIPAFDLTLHAEAGTLRLRWRQDSGAHTPGHDGPERAAALRRLADTLAHAAEVADLWVHSFLEHVCHRALRDEARLTGKATGRRAPAPEPLRLPRRGRPPC